MALWLSTQQEYFNRLGTKLYIEVDTRIRSDYYLRDSYVSGYADMYD